MPCNNKNHETDKLILLKLWLWQFQRNFKILNTLIFYGQQQVHSCTFPRDTIDNSKINSLFRIYFLKNCTVKVKYWWMVTVGWYIYIGNIYIQGVQKKCPFYIWFKHIKESTFFRTPCISIRSVILLLLYISIACYTGCFTKNALVENNLTMFLCKMFSKEGIFLIHPVLSKRVRWNWRTSWNCSLLNQNK